MLQQFLGAADFEQTFPRRKIVVDVYHDLAISESSPIWVLFREGGLIWDAENPKAAAIKTRLLGQAKALPTAAACGLGKTHTPGGLGISLRGRFDSHLSEPPAIYGKC
jgi:hypothetical protein